MSRLVVLELAVNGSTSPAVNPHVPRTPDRITEDMLAGVEGGASILHNHTDDTMFTATGVHDPAPYVEAWGPVLEAHPDVLLYPTMAAGARGIAIEDRWAHVEALGPRGGMTLVDPGSVNVGLTEGGEVPDAAAPAPYANSFADTAHMFARTAALGLAPSISVFEPGFLRTALVHHRAGRVAPGAIVKLYFGGHLAFGLPPTRTALDAYLELLEPSGLPWSVAVLGGDVVASGLAAYAVERGGHLRVGLEDHAGPSPSAEPPTNAELLRGAVEVVEAAGCRVATPRETRDLLGVRRP